MKDRPDLTIVGALCAVVFLAAGAPAEAQTTTYLRGRVQLLSQAAGQLPVIRVGGVNVSLTPTTVLRFVNLGAYPLPVSGTAVVTACE